MKICFVAGNAYSLLSQDYFSQKIGGAELQQVMIAKGLQELGYDISFIVADCGQKDGEQFEGITVYKTYKDDEGIPGLRYYYIKLPKIWRALKRADADIYYIRGASFLPAILSFFCKKHSRKFIFAGASDNDFVPGNFLIPTLRDRILYRFGIKKADAIILQTETQRELLKSKMRLNGIVIRNMPFSRKKNPVLCAGEYVLWVATIKELKRPEFFLMLAKKYPEEKFVMIGGPGTRREDQFLYKKIKKQCTNLANLEFLGFRPYHETEAYFDKAKVFVNTSRVEGFPNTFLQAWSRGIPVITFVDPDGLVRKNKLGKVVNTYTEMEYVLAQLLKDYIRYKQHISQLYSREFSREIILLQYDSLLKRLVN